MTDHPERDPATTVAIGFRDELLGKGWPDARHVADLAGLSPERGDTAYAIQARATGALLGVWSAPQHRFIYPDFQFNRSGALRKDVAELLAVLPANKDDRGGWRRAFWLYSSHALLDGQTPADVFANAPIRVIKVAREEFLSDPEVTW
ncbi:hypothetical protein [Paraburkholderia sp. BL25I1N1]|uniref:hypothetical protein n=1 Tax=Paraburkholderia sp. BL25I1N1 TaxID=1938804 RepID=UPI000D04ED58|nr:hypothetical protein [Paraburkholderia sp. BL25I1N1]PRY04408.1 hypothetical protein B0G73_11284 [Paraburkholderia sp. BL25I1N1]